MVSIHILLHFKKKKMCEKENNFECALKIHYFVNIRNKNAQVSGFTKNLKNYQKKKGGKENFKATER